MADKKDPTEPIRKMASSFDGVEIGSSCTQTSFKVNKKAFLYIGMQGGRYKAMFKLQDSKEEASELAEKNPDYYEVGSTTYVTARFTAEKPMPTKLWKKWLEESYRLSVGNLSSKKAVKTTKKASAARKGTAKNTQRKSAKKKKSS